MIKWVIAHILLGMGLLGTVCACAPVRAPERADFFAMDTFIRLDAYGKNAGEALAACQSEMKRIEALLSVSSEYGDVYRINHAEGGQTRVSAETVALLVEAFAVSAQTGGAFDPTVYPLVECWGFFDAAQRVPDAQQIEKLLPLVGWENALLHADTVKLPAGAGVDLGGVAKGYAADRLAGMLRANGIESALLSLGGNVYALGAKPDGGEWRIGVQDPASETGVLGVVHARDEAVVTAGSYQRRFAQDGVTYHHILDPKTGYPADSGLVSVTVICDSATRADALSTALFVMGAERATAFWLADRDFAAIFVQDDGTVLYTQNASFVPSVDDSRSYRILVY